MRDIRTTNAIERRWTSEPVVGHTTQQSEEWAPDPSNRPSRRVWSRRSVQSICAAADSVSHTSRQCGRSKCQIGENSPIGFVRSAAAKELRIVLSSHEHTSHFDSKATRKIIGLGWCICTIYVLCIVEESGPLGPLIS